MSKGLTTAQLAEISKNEVKTRTLLTITPRTNPPEVIRILENDTLASFEYDGETYLAGMVKRGKIESSMQGGPQKCNIKISNINRHYSSIIVDYTDVLTNARCSIDEVIYFPPGHSTLLLEDGSGSLLLEDGSYLLLEDDHVIGDAVNVFEGYINNIKLNETVFSFDVERILGGYSTQSPNTTFDVNCQWVFKDERCQYSGGETTCDKTLTACQTRSNVVRFGGYPSIPAELVIKG